MNRKSKLILTSVILLVILAGCGRQAEVKPEDIITLDTAFFPFFQKEWFNAIFVWPFAQIINYLTPSIGVVLSIGIATIIVNVLTFPITLKGTASSQRLQLIQPEMAKIQKKYEGMKDQNSMMRQQQEMSLLYKKYDIKIGRMLLGNIITLPIMFAFLSVIRRTSAVVHGDFLGIHLSTTISDGFNMGRGNWIYLLLFIFMGVAQVISMMLPSYLAKKQLKKERKIKSYVEQPKAANSQNSTMYVMMVLILLMSYSWPAAMSVYWFFSSVVASLKTLYTTYVYKPKGVKAK